MQRIGRVLSFVGRPKPRTVGMDPAETAAAEPGLELGAPRHPPSSPASSPAETAAAVFCGTELSE
jgi:hypothetical protein